MKRMHLFIIKSFLGPLAATFFICLFIFLMQFLWKYIDDLVGKGLEWHVITELLFYACQNLIPMALPLAILLASIMTFGNLGENYELIAMKAAGISLLRIMKPLIILLILISIGAFFFTNNVLPHNTMKLYTLMWDIRQKRPDTDIKEKVFYYGLEGFAIKIDNKDPETNMMYDIMIYNHTDNKGNTNVTVADSGIIRSNKKQKYMTLTLYSGESYENLKLSKQSYNNQTVPFQRSNFSMREAILDLSGQDLKRSNENIYRNHYKMLSLSQLQEGEDSLKTDLVIKHTHLAKTMRNNYLIRDRLRKKAINDSLPNPLSVGALNADSLYQTLNLRQQYQATNEALNNAKRLKQDLSFKVSEYDNYEKLIRKHKLEWHRKFSLSLACIIFFFIGAPLGAIIRKGGLGMPVVISILFFIIYYILDTFGNKFAREGVLPVWEGAWMSTFLLFPIGVFLTYQAVTDSIYMSGDFYRNFIKKVVALIKKKKGGISPLESEEANN